MNYKPAYNLYWPDERSHFLIFFAFSEYINFNKNIVHSHKYQTYITEEDTDVLNIENLDMSALHEIGIKTFENGRQLMVKLDRKYLKSGLSKC